MKIGIEIHQRLDVGKLFCSCSSKYVPSEEKDASGSFYRFLNVAKSEVGGIDEAARYEVSKGKRFKYIYTTGHACLVEADEEPPNILNPKALKICLTVVKMLNAIPVNEIYFMRKIVVDGSNTTGFQRTAIIGMHGFIKTSKGKVGIETIALEEESAGIVYDSEMEKVYDLNRLGIPLIEIATTPSIKDGEHLRETAEKIGLMLRTIPGVARGLGTIRQDINISADDGVRVEIKGVQDLRLFPTIVSEEINRRRSLRNIFRNIYSKLKDKIIKGKISNDFASKLMDLSDIFLGTKSRIISKALNSNLRVFGFLLKGFAGIFGMHIQVGRRFGTEISDYVKSCGVRGIIHSDEDLSRYGINDNEINKIRSSLRASKSDLFVLVLSDVKTAKCVRSNIIKRISNLSIQEETRKANKDGSTSFLRPMPGRSRMYPETDVPPIRISKDLYNSITFVSLDDKLKKLEKLVGKDMASVLIRSKNLGIFEYLVSKGINPMLAATTLENTLISIRRDGIDVGKLNKDTLHTILNAVEHKRLTKTAVEQVLRDLCSSNIPLDKILKRYTPIRGNALMDIIQENEYDMKRVMSKYRLRVFPEEVLHMIKSKRTKGME